MKKKIFFSLLFILFQVIQAQDIKYKIILPYDYEGTVRIVSGLRGGNRWEREGNIKILHIPQSGVLFLKKKETHFQRLTKKGKVEYIYKDSIHQTKLDAVFSSKEDLSKKSAILVCVYSSSYPFRKAKRISRIETKTLKEFSTFNFCIIEKKEAKEVLDCHKVCKGENQYDLIINHLKKHYKLRPLQRFDNESGIYVPKRI